MTEKKVQMDLDQWKEIYATLASNKWRTILTAFGVSWGIFMLIIMLGAGNGLQNGTMSMFSGRVANSIFMWSMRTSIPHGGYREGRRIQMTNDDVDLLRENVEEIDLISPGLQLGGWRGANNVSRGDKIGAFEINGFMPNAREVKLLDMKGGRFINDRDIDEYRKVCVIGDITREMLFDPGEDPIGGYIQVQGMFFKVVGHFKSTMQGDRAENEDRSIYIPFSTFQRSFNQGNKVGWLVLTAKDGTDAEVVEEKAKNVLKKRHNVHPRDARAFGGFNLGKQMQRFTGLFTGVKLLSWFVGGLTLLAGVIGISNIMLVIVKERTNEIGIRRALGATPGVVIKQIILESVTLTALAGITGFMAGVFLLEQVGGLIDHEFFTNPEVDLSVSVIALSILIVAGVLAGIIPAARAVKIKPIDALRTE